MKLLFLLLFSFSICEAHAASCCVANTSVPNLMILPAKWQQTFTLASSQVVGDVDPKGQSTFRTSKNKETTNIARMDLAFSWTEKYQNGISVRYQNKKRSFSGTEANDSGWGDLGLFQAYQPIKYQRTYLYNSTNFPTSNSVYDSNQALAVNARGTGAYQTGLGIFHVENFKTWDLLLSTETHYSFARTFGSGSEKTKVGGFWGTSLSLGAGYIPWRSKFRFGMNVSPRLEGQKTITMNDAPSTSKQSVVWDSVLNVTFTKNEWFAVGIGYLDQTWFGPARNTLLNRSVSLIFQMHYL